MDNDPFDGQSQLDQLGVRQHESGGHPVVAGAAWFLSVALIRHCARAHLERTAGPRKAQAFFRHADSRLWTGLGVLGAAILIAAFVGNVNLTIANAVFGLGLLAFLVLAVPPGIDMISYAYKEIQFQRQALAADVSKLLR